MSNWRENRCDWDLQYLTETHLEKPKASSEAEANLPQKCVLPCGP